MIKDSGPEFLFERARGLVWVCDVAESTRFLNDDGHVDALEQYLPRLYWTAIQAVTAADGVFIKWTGDGFLAWFPTPLERQIGQCANRVFTAAWHLTFLSNVTTLGVKSSAKIKLRHAVTYEPDALLLNIKNHEGHASQDLLGRAVVSAFRMSGISSPFPSIVTQAQLVKAYARTQERPVAFRRRNISNDERLRYFKGERGTTGVLYVPEDSASRRRRSVGPVVRNTKRVLKSLESPITTPTVATRFSASMLDGPEWSQRAAQELYEFADKKLLRALKELLPMLERQMRADKTANPSLQLTPASGRS